MSNLLLNAVGRSENSKEYVPESAEESQNFQEEYAILSQNMAQALLTDSKSKEELELEEGGWESDDSLAAAQRFFSSMVLGWGDEIGLATAASAAYATTDGATWSEIYADMRKTYDTEQQRFEKEHSGAALAADIAGSIASPVNLLRTPQLAMQGGKAVANLGRVAAEGAVYGAGEAKQGAMLEGAAEGALGATLGYGVLKGAGKALKIPVNIATKRRVEGDLVDGVTGEFIPLTLAARDPKGSEGFLHTLYRDVVGPAFGAKGVIKEQEDVIIKPIADVIEQQKILTKKVEEGARQELSRVTGDFSDARQLLKEQYNNTQKAIRQESKGVTVPLSEKLKPLKTGKAEQIVSKATSDVTKVLDSRRLMFRDNAFTEALPDSATSKDVQRLLSISDLGSRAREIDRIWANKGYEALKARKYRFKANEFNNKMLNMIKKDVYFAVNIKDNNSFMSMFKKIQNDIEFFKDKSGRVDGTKVAALRAKLGSVANSAVDDQVSRAYRQMQLILDDIAKEQMPEKARKSFEAESKKWKTNVILREALGSAQNDPKKRGAFTEADWITAVNKNKEYDKRYASGPLNRTARTLEENLNAATKSIAKRAAQQGKVKANMIESVIRSHNKKLVKELENAETAKKSALRRLRTDQGAAEEAARKTKDISSMKAEIAATDKSLKELKILRSPENPSWYHTLAAHGMLSVVGLGVAGPFGAATGAAAAFGLARGLSKPSVQKTLAGQMPLQQNVQRMIQSDASGLTADVLSRAVGRPLGEGMLTGVNQ